jgi:hypothetical protein
MERRLNAGFGELTDQPAEGEMGELSGLDLLQREITVDREPDGGAGERGNVTTAVTLARRSSRLTGSRARLRRVSGNGSPDVTRDFAPRRPGRAGLYAGAIRSMD